MWKKIWYEWSSLSGCESHPSIRKQGTYHPANVLYGVIFTPVAEFDEIQKSCRSPKPVKHVYFSHAEIVVAPSLDLFWVLSVKCVSEQTVQPRNKMNV